jgi:hypothetical protein
MMIYLPFISEGMSFSALMISTRHSEAGVWDEITEVREKGEELERMENEVSD